MKFIKPVFIVSDLLGISISYLLFIHNLISTKSSSNSIVLLFFLIWIWYFTSRFPKTYNENNFIDSVVQFTSLVKLFVVFIITSFFLIQIVLPREFSFFQSAIHFYVYFISFNLLFTIFIRLLFFILRRNKRIDMTNEVNTLVIGDEKNSKKLILDIIPQSNLDIKGCHFLSSKELEMSIDNSIQTIESLIQEMKILNIIIFHNSLNQDTFQKIINFEDRFMIRVFIVPNFEGINLFNSQVINYKGYPIIRRFNEPLETNENRWIKRFFDVIFSLLVLFLLLSWLAPLIVVLIKLESKGSAFFKQKRSGYLNKDFYCYKFRSMRVENNSTTNMTTKNDERITKIGYFLRKTSLDELPQFLNVLLGNMSVVGPRPHVVSQTKKYSEISQKYMIRHFVKPGITGWAQINGNRGEIKNKKDIENRVEKDIWYIHNWSFLLDIKIIFLTVLNIIKGDKQAY